MFDAFSSSTWAIFSLDLVAILVLTLGVYLPRHRRMDLVVAFVGVNIGVLAVSMVLASAQVGAGLGLGLFGVLSIIRLRSTEISHREVAYYFASLALGLVTGMSNSVSGLLLVSVALIVGVLAVLDASVLQHAVSQTVVLDRAIANQRELYASLHDRIFGRVISASVVRLDYVNDSTVVDVRFVPGGEA